MNLEYVFLLSMHKLSLKVIKWKKIQRYFQKSQVKKWRMKVGTDNLMNL